MAKAIILRKHGKPNVLKLENIDLEKPKRNEILIRQTAIGVHFHDVYVRSGLYKTLSLPGIPGVEAVGVIEEVGNDVNELKIGDRIVYITGSYGAYASHRLLDKNLAIKLPEFISDELMATNFSRALTVKMLLEKVTKLTSDNSILVTAATGGVGKLLCQVANSIGAMVIGSVSSYEKVEIAKKYGCRHSFVYDQNQFVEKIFDLTNGKGLDFVFDSVGMSTINNSIESLSFCGHLVNFGQSSGPINPLEMSMLAKKSLTITRPILFHYLTNLKVYKDMSNSVFNLFKEEVLETPETFSIELENAAKAHEILESRKGGGSIYLNPQ